MKILLRVLLIGVILGVAAGFYIKKSDPAQGDLVIGLSLVVGVFILMPVFIYHRYKDRNVKDFMLDKDSIERMRRYQYGDQEE